MQVISNISDKDLLNILNRKPKKGYVFDLSYEKNHLTKDYPAKLTKELNDWLLEFLPNKYKLVWLYGTITQIEIKNERDALLFKMAWI